MEKERKPDKAVDKPISPKEESKSSSPFLPLLLTILSPCLLYGLLLLIFFLSSEPKAFSLPTLWQSGVEILPFLTLDSGVYLFLRKDSSVPKKDRTPDQINYPFQEKPKNWKNLSFLFLVLAILFFFLAIFLNIFFFEKAWWTLFFYFFDFLYGVFYLQRRKWKKDSLKIKHDLGKFE